MIKTLTIGAIATIALTACGGDTTDTTDDYAPLMQAAENCQDATGTAVEVLTVDQIIDTYTVCHDAYANLETGNDNVDAAITDVYRAYNTARVTAEWSAPLVTDALADDMGAVTVALEALNDALDTELDK